jgi:hypothetical protein
MSHPFPTRISSPTCCPLSTAAPPPAPPPRAIAPRSRSRTVPAGQPDRYATPPPPLAAPLCGCWMACVCPDGRPGRALGFVLPRLSDTSLLPDATPLPDTGASRSPATGQLDCADVCPSPRTVGPGHVVPPGCASPPRLPALSLSRRRCQLAPVPPPRALSPLNLNQDRTSWPARPVCHAAAAACRPPCAATGRRACASMAGRAVRWGFSLLTPAREMLAPASIFN